MLYQKKESLTVANIITAFALLALIGFAIVFLAGCTTRVSYQHTYYDENNVKHIIDSVYTAGVGNSQKSDIVVIYPDKALWYVGSSTMDQDKYMEMLIKYGDILELIAEDFKNAYPVGEIENGM